MTRRPITFICAYYENPGMFREQQRIWRTYPADVRRAFHVIVTDDGSPVSPARPHVADDTGVASLRLFRTRVDVRWNWLFCRNLGVWKATTRWVLLTDIDHVVPLETLDYLQTAPLHELDVFRFARVDAPARTPYKPHPNTWFLTREMFDRIGGYDERFSGYYGTDAEFRERVQATARAVVMLSQVMVRYPREHIADASTTTYGRKEPQDAIHVRRIREERARNPGWKTQRVTFPYELQCEVRHDGRVVEVAAGPGVSDQLSGRGRQGAAADGGAALPLSPSVRVRHRRPGGPRWRHRGR